MKCETGWRNIGHIRGLLLPNESYFLSSEVGVKIHIEIFFQYTHHFPCEINDRCHISSLVVKQE